MSACARQLAVALMLASAGCVDEPADAPPEPPAAVEAGAGRIVVYQAFTRLFGNREMNNVPWGTVEENGVGKFADFTDTALAAIRELGVTHVWYTGVPHHAVIRDYADYGISPDDPDVVKGRAGSPYAVKDYYSVNPDLAVDPARRLEEFRALVARTHAQGMKVVIDIVPNHVARRYESVGKPDGVEDFGARDDSSVEYRRDNNFYYLPGEPFRVPETPAGYEPLGGNPHPLADGRFEEFPARWTGNGARAAQPAFTDWYETVKINYGVRPDGSHDFPALPAEYANRDYRAHGRFWRDRDVPDSWIKFRDIALYWLQQGVDGFRYDMAEMVPVEFWSYLNASIRAAKPEAFLLAEIYNPAAYRDYIGRGLMGYLYDKVGTYDTLRAIVEGRAGTDGLVELRASLDDIDANLLRFLENHDEQRIASPAFAGDPDRARPAMAVTATIGSGPTMVYFGQEVGEQAAGDPGFGDPTRTSIFDYWGVPAHQRWMNGGRFDGGLLTSEERALRDFYARLLRLTRSEPALAGEYADLHAHNRREAEGYDERLFSFARWQGDDRLIIVSNFSAEERYEPALSLPSSIVSIWGLGDGTHTVRDLLAGDYRATLSVEDGAGRLPLSLEPLQSLILQVD